MSRRDERWNQYDCDIQRCARAYNAHLSDTPGFRFLDWRLVKAMVWTESGGPERSAWRTSPIQIGNEGDPGLKALFSGKEGGELILPPPLKLSPSAARANPTLNIAAGMGYLLMRLAKFGFVHTLDERDPKIYEVSVQSRESLASIARKNGTAIQSIRQFSVNTMILRPGQTIRFRKARVVKSITGWTPITTSAIARTYNVGDPAYAQKLEYCLKAMSSVMEEAKCEQ